MRWPIRLVRASVLDELREKADQADALQTVADEAGLQAVHFAATQLALQMTQIDKARALENLDQAVDDLQVHILRRARAIELLQQIHDVPPEAAEHIRLACDALIRGGEVVPA
ncbi:hypothetical protein [Streptomyces marianii]|uniref:Uncharacterized protein n=1 Tax=Streptomyces marianii TaxID=1817406 RepID=A0A5R9DR78_9ACTN|nr:hypothetical protein [Streptomyces marianii]TLQ38996.1 hypothetical protein FEF34_39985 [Streptomyces marianii]